MNILIAGVGGQGTLLASRVLGNYALLKGLDCKLSEVHGMAQRGGSVVTYVRMGEKIYSPLIDEGQADILLAFEKLEALRYSGIVKSEGKIIYSSQEILPMPVVTGAAKYPEKIEDKLENAIAINAMEIAESLGNTKVTNTVMLGALVKILNLEYETVLTALKQSIPPKTVEVNEKAFLAGYNII
jgi:indolepyruvate ferredoxin oxidoreductase beta subunit